MTYITNIKYLDCPGLFDAGKLEFTLAAGERSAIQKVAPESPVYERAKRDFTQAGYMYPAPPLYLGQRDIEFPDEQLYVLRLLIKEPGSAFIMPAKLSFLREYIEDCALYHREHFPHFDDLFIYLTLRSGVVQSVIAV